MTHDWRVFEKKIIDKLQPILQHHGYGLSWAEEFDEPGGGFTMGYENETPHAITISVIPKIHMITGEDIYWFRVQEAGTNIELLAAIPSVSKTYKFGEWQHANISHEEIGKKIAQLSLRGTYKLGGWQYTTEEELDDRIEQAISLLERYFASQE